MATEKSIWYLINFITYFYLGWEYITWPCLHLQLPPNICMKLIVYYKMMNVCEHEVDISFSHFPWSLCFYLQPIIRLHLSVKSGHNYEQNSHLILDTRHRPNISKKFYSIQWTWQNIYHILTKILILMYFEPITHSQPE